MKIYISPYELEFQNGSNRIQGALLLFEFTSDLKGYGDFLPQPGFGEKTLKDQLKDLRQNKESVRFTQVKKIAFHDALARREKRSLFSGLKIPDSHFLVENLASFSHWNRVEEKGYRTIKVKIRRRDFQKQLKRLREGSAFLPDCRWRLDLNGSLNCQEWDSFKKSLQFLWNKMDFIEDPFKNPGGFTGKDSSLFAEDWISFPQGAVQIVKPGRDSIDGLIRQGIHGFRKKIVFTHSRETLLGCSATAWSAGRFYRKHSSFWMTCALKCRSFKKSRWTRNEDESPVFTPPFGFGLGFDRLLKKEPWKRWM